MSLGSFLKRAMAFLLYVTGITRCLLRYQFSSRGKVLVLLYHEIRKPRNRFETAVSPEHFEEQIRFIKKEFEVVSVSRMLEILSRKEKPARPLAVVTFDDGYRDNYTAAYPILKKYGVPAAIFLAVESLGNESPMWTARVESLFEGASAESLRLETLPGAKVYKLGNNYQQRMKTCYDVKTEMKRLPDADRRIVLKELEEKLKADREDRNGPYCEMLSWEEVGLLAGDPLITIGSHSMSHRMLANLPPEEMLSELEASKRKIEEKTGREVAFVSYPGNSYNGATLDFARQAGYRAGFAVRQSLTGFEDDWFELKRVHIEDEPLYAFQADISLVMKFFYACFGKS